MAPGLPDPATPSNHDPQRVPHRAEPWARLRIRVRSRAGFIAVPLAVLLAACGGGRSPRDPSPLRVGTIGTDPPFSQCAGETCFGIDIDLARDLGRTLGRPVVFVRTRWSTLLPDLLEGRFDIAMSGIHATDERRSAAHVSRPYLRSGKQAIVRCSEIGRFVTLHDVDRLGVRVLTVAGGTGDSFAMERLPNAMNLRNASGSDVYEKLAAGEGDIVFADAPEATFQANHYPTLCIGLNGELFGEYETVVLMPRQDDLARPIDRWLTGRLHQGYVSRLVNAHCAIRQSTAHAP